MADKLIENVKIWMVSVVWFFLMCFVLMTMAGQDTVTSNGKLAKELEVEKLLKKLNKPAVKSIKSADGDIFDCVDILNQPAFDDPKLKTHKIQMRPAFYPKGTNFSKSNPIIAQLWHKNGSCPKGTIPIRRTKKDDILRADSIQQFGKKINQTIPDLSAGSLYAAFGHEYAISELRGDRYYGAQASINIWKSHIQQFNELSISQIWIMNEDDSNNVETIEAGWQIYPGLYGDDNPRLFIYWTSDSYGRTGCYNLRCSGFVQVDNRIAVGGSLQTSSVYGSSQYALSILIWKDPGSGNWWMLLEGSVYVGYWPASLFNHMSSQGASNVEWGGEIINRRNCGQHTTTEMGSGHFPEEGFGKASFYKEISTVNKSNYLVSPKCLLNYASNSRCYDISPYANSNDWGVYFFYGGPGRNEDCP